MAFGGRPLSFFAAEVSAGGAATALTGGWASDFAGGGGLGFRALGRGLAAGGGAGTGGREALAFPAATTGEACEEASLVSTLGADFALAGDLTLAGDWPLVGDLIDALGSNLAAT